MSTHATEPTQAGGQQPTAGRRPAGAVTLTGLASHHGLTLQDAAGTDPDHLLVTGVAQSSATARPGDLFVAVPGARVHGAAHAASAVAAGAVAVLTDPDGAALLAGTGLGAPVLTAPSAAALLRATGPVAAEVHGSPADSLTTLAVTGTNGKTTTATMTDHVLRRLGRVTGLIGTVEVTVAGRTRPAVLTTPQPADLQRLLAELRDEGGTHLSMEVSSHAMSLGRTEPLVFDAAAFTNLTQDHLDFHETLEDYFEAKAALLEPARSRRAVVCVDDPWGRRLADRLLASRAPGEVLTLRTPLADAGAAAYPAAWEVTDVVEEPSRTRFTLRGPGGVLATSTSLPGLFNTANAAVALLLVHATGEGLDKIGQALGEEGVSPTVPGRVEAVTLPAGAAGADSAPTLPRVLVDFAHNPGALSTVLSALRPTVTGRLILVFGATGSRDTGKRPDMARLAMEGADAVIVTDDDPHDEDPAPIRATLMETAVPLAGTPGHAATVEEVPDREAAIHRALALAGPDDTVLVAGRGHETVQDVAGRDVALDDRAVAADALQEAARRLAPTQGGHR